MVNHLCISLLVFRLQSYTKCYPHHQHHLLLQLKDKMIAHYHRFIGHQVQLFQRDSNPFFAHAENFHLLFLLMLDEQKFPCLILVFHHRFEFSFQLGFSIEFSLNHFSSDDCLHQFVQASIYDILFSTVAQANYHTYHTP